MRAAIYARYSSDLQDARSCADQLTACRARLASEGWSEIATYSDAAMSGASNRRPGYSQLISAIESGLVDIVVAEALDRLSRDMEHVAALFKAARFGGVRIVTLSEGEISELHIGMNGAMNALFLKQLGEKTKRGQRGQLSRGKVPGGLCFGYRAAGIGEREIAEDEAGVIRRIFAMYLDGVSVSEIAGVLNAEGAPSPRGGRWATNTIIGSRRRQTGILRNELYAGEMVWNRQSYRKNPATGRKCAVPNPPGEWERAAMPHLRIVDEATWAAVQDRLARRTKEIAKPGRRATRPLSGLLTCAACGEALVMTARDRYVCRRAKQHSMCEARRSVVASAIEDRVFSALRSALSDPVYAEAYAEAYAHERRSAMARAAQQRRAASKRLAEAERRFARAREALLDSPAGSDTGVFRDMLAGADRDLRAARAEADRAPAEPPAVDFRIAARAAWSNRIRRLADLASEPDAETRARIAAELRLIIDTIRVDTNKSPPTITVEGDFAALLASTQTLVAGAGFEPATFRL